MMLQENVLNIYIKAITLNKHRVKYINGENKLNGHNYRKLITNIITYIINKKIIRYRILSYFDIYLSII